MLLWMAWTWQTAVFFGFITLCLIVLTLLAIYRPETPRTGLLGFPTTRGDRFFVTLLGAAFIFVFGCDLAAVRYGTRSPRPSLTESRCFASRKPI